MPRRAPRRSPGRAHIRSLGTLLGFLLAFCLVSFHALGVDAQAPPGHAHAWEAADPVPTPVVEPGQSPVPAGGLVPLLVTNVGAETDRCTSETICSFFGNLALGLFFGRLYQLRGRTTPLVIAHFLIDAAAGLGYLALRGHVWWLPG